MTLYMTLGGRNAIVQAMPKLHDRLKEDPCFDITRLSAQFERSDDLCEFLIFLLGGSPVYDGKPVYELLSPLANDPGLYDRFVDHLVSVLIGTENESRVETDLRDIMVHFRPQVLDPKPVSPTRVYSLEANIMRM